MTVKNVIFLSKIRTKQGLNYTMHLFQKKKLRADDPVAIARRYIVVNFQQNTVIITIWLILSRFYRETYHNAMLSTNLKILSSESEQSRQLFY